MENGISDKRSLASADESGKQQESGEKQKDWRDSGTVQTNFNDLMSYMEWGREKIKGDGFWKGIYILKLININ